MEALIPLILVRIKEEEEEARVIKKQLKKDLNKIAPKVGNKDLISMVYEPF
jgi:hypothetical protein